MKQLLDKSLHENINISCHDPHSFQKAIYDRESMLNGNSIYSRSYKIELVEINSDFIDCVGNHFPGDRLWFDASSEDYHLIVFSDLYRIEFEKTYPSSSGCNLVVHARDREVLDNLMEKLYSIFPKKGEKSVEVHWFYKNSRNELTSVDISLNEENQPIKEMYPFIEGELDDYYQKFIDSSSNILLLIGPPGTGKTTFIRGLLSKARKKVMTASDATVLMSDSIFIEFVSGCYEYFVVEDADEFLLSREDQENGIMNKLLNTSDGIISVPKNKKMIFSTNLQDIDSVDSALIRPGRCFDVLHFSPLKKDEANILIKKVGIENVEVKKEMTIAEIMTQKDNIEPEKIKKTKIGFI